jgi:hypothetical protein
MGVNFGEKIFQQSLIIFLNGSDTGGPGHHAFQNPCEYLLWSFLKDTVYKNNPHTHNLRTEIRNFGGSDQGQ